MKKHNEFEMKIRYSVSKEELQKIDADISTIFPDEIKFQFGIIGKISEYCNSGNGEDFSESIILKNIKKLLSAQQHQNITVSQFRDILRDLDIFL